MFASLLGSRKDPRSTETTPLLQALSRYRNRHADPSVHGDDQDRDENVNDGPRNSRRFPRYQEPDEDDDEDEDEDNDGGQRDGPLLPVFSSEFLGMSIPSHYPLDCLPIYMAGSTLTLSLFSRSHSYLQHYARHSDPRHPAM